MSQIRRRVGADKRNTLDWGGEEELPRKSIPARVGPTEVTDRFAKRTPLAIVSPKLDREPSRNASSGGYWVHGEQLSASLALDKTESCMSAWWLICRCATELPVDRE